MAERRHERSFADECPRWCTRGHSGRDHPEDDLHQSPPEYAVLVAGQPWVTGSWPEPSPVVARLVRPVGATLTWLEVSSEEGAQVRVCLTTESARELVGLLESLLGAAGA